MIHRNVGFGIDGRQFMLGRRHLIVLGLGGYAHLPQLHIHVPHKRSDPLTDGSKVMVVQFLSFRRHGSKQGPSCVDQVLPLHKLLCVHQEIFLFRPYHGGYLPGRSIAEMPDQPQGLLPDGFHRPQKRSLLIQRLSGVRTECGRDTQRGARRVMTHKGRGRTVPGGIASCLECGPQPSGRERGRVRLSLDQFLAGETHQHLPVLQRRGDKGIVFLRRYASKRLEPVGIMGCPLLDGPFLHLVSDHIRRCGVQLLPFLDGLLQILVDLLRKPLLHHGIVKHVFSKNISYIKCFSHSSPVLSSIESTAVQGKAFQLIRRNALLSLIPLFLRNQTVPSSLLPYR